MKLLNHGIADYGSSTLRTGEPIKQVDGESGVVVFMKGGSGIVVVEKVVAIKAAREATVP